MTFMNIKKFWNRGVVKRMNKLIEMLSEVVDQSKKGKRFMKKYNLSINDIRMLMLIVDGKCKECFCFNLLPVLDDFKINYTTDEINFYLA